MPLLYLILSNRSFFSIRKQIEKFMNFICNGANSLCLFAFIL